MKIIPLTQNLVALVDDEDFDKINNLKWHAKKSSHKHDESCTYYAVRRDGYRRIWMHRVIMSPDENLKIDHINRNGLDNRKSNLRVCRHQQNLFNSKVPIHNKLGIKGVCWNRKQLKFEAYIKTNGKQKHLGYFKTAEEASSARDSAAMRLHGEYAHLNLSR